MVVKMMPPEGRLLEQLAQAGPGVGLHRRLAQQLGRAREHAEQLVVQVVAVGHHHQGRVAHGRVLHQLGREAGHLDALAGALRVPHHAALAALGGLGLRAGGHQHALDHRAHRVELVIAGHLLDQPALVLEQDEVAQVVQQQFALEQAMHQRLQLAHGAQRVDRLAVDGAPGHEAFPVGRQRADTGLEAVADDQQRIAQEQVGNVVLVGLQLVEGGPQVGVLVAGVLELDHHHRQSVEEQHHVRAAGPASDPGC